MKGPATDTQAVRTLLFAATALLAASAPCAAVNPEDAPPFAEPPGRYDLPPLNTGMEGGSVPADATWQELKAVMLGGSASPGKADRVRADAVHVFSKRVGSAEQDAPEQMPSMVEDAAGAMETLLEEERDPRFRRYAVARIFGATAAAVRDHIPFHPEAAWARKAWKRLGAVKRRGLRDRDPRLAEFFERYEPLAGGPSWSPAKERYKTRLDKAAAELPEYAAILQKIWDLCSSIEDGQRDVSDRISRELRKRPGGRTPAGKALVRRFRETFDYRMYSNWANMLPHAVEEQLGHDEAERRGFKKQPVKLGWPDFGG